MNGKFVLVDGNNFAHIAFHRAKSIILKNKQKKEPDRKKAKLIKLEESDFETVEGMMYVVFFRKFHKYLKMFKEHYFIMTWDNPGSSKWRREVYSEYKAKRDYTKDPIWRILFTGIDTIREILQSYPVCQEKVDKLEADDIMYVFSRELSKSNEVVILSGDSDMIQAVQDFKVKLFHPLKDKYIKSPTTFDYCVYKAIKGDKSDNIEGLHGYGEKNATRLAEEIYPEDFIDDFSCEELSREQQDLVLRNLKIIRIANNPNLKNAKVDYEKMQECSAVDLKKIKKHYFDHRLKSLVEDFDSVVNIFSQGE